MFPQLKKINNESGIVLFIVLMVSIVIMLFSLGILTQSANETNYAQQQVDQITAEELAKGIFWNEYSTGMTGAVSIGTVMNGRLYNISVVPQTTAGGVTPWTVVTNYDTFQ